MKTKTTNPTKIGENTNARNFFQKTFILLAILAFSSFGFKAKAQQNVWYDVTNTATAGCNWTIRTYDNASVQIDVFTVIGGATYSGCRTLSGIIDYIVVEYNGLCYLWFGSGNLGGGGSWSYNSYLSPCGGSTCSSSVDCVGVSPGPTGCTDGYITININ